MKYFTLFIVVAVGFEAVFGQVIRSPSVVASPACLPTEVVYSSGVTTPAIIQSNSVAASLADTLSLLTVSSLLAEKLPLAGPAVVATIPTTSGCGCGPYGYLY